MAVATSGTGNIPSLLEVLLAAMRPATASNIKIVVSNIVKGALCQMTSDQPRAFARTQAERREDSERGLVRAAILVTPNRGAARLRSKRSANEGAIAAA